MLFLLLLTSMSGWSQSGTGQFINYGVKDGLCEAVCSGVAQDSRGFYWISTPGGVSRFDGANFKSYYPSEMLGEEQMLDNSRVFFECVPNRLLFTLGNTEAFVLNTISQDFTPVKSLKNKIAGSFQRMDKNRILVPSIDTVFILNNQLEIIQTIIPPFRKKRSGIEIAQLSASGYLISSQKERFIYDLEKNQFRRFETNLPDEGLFNTGFGLLHVDQVRQKIYLVNFFKGLFQLDYEGKITRVWDQSLLQINLCGLPNKIIPDQNNQEMVWICGTNGVSHFNLRTCQSTNYSNDPQASFSISDNETNNLFLDRYRNLWVTTYSGVSVLNRNASFISNWDLKLSAAAPLMYMCRISEDELLAAKYYDGVYRINEKSGKSEKYLPQQLTDTWFIFRDGSQLIHGGKGTVLKSIDLYSGKSADLTFLKNYFKQSELVSMGFRHSSGAWWFSGNSGGGLVRYNPKTKAIRHFSRAKKSFSGSYFTNYSEAPNGDLWFSSNKTQVLTHWIRSEDRFEEIHFDRIFEKSHQSIILCIATDQKGNVWIGFEGGGLVRYSVADKKTKVFGKKQGIPSNFIYHMTFDDQQRLWVGTRKGLACLGKDLRTVQCFGLQNGFPAECFDQASWFDKQTNMLWIASDKYLLRFSPDKLLKTEQPGMAVFIDEFLVSNEKQALETLGNHYFSPDQNTVQLAFTTINPPGENQVEYSYLLEGASGGWVSLGTNSQVNFPSLSFGVYTFRLRAKIPGMKTWIYLKDPLHFEIATPWYRTWWFKLFIFLASAGLIFWMTCLFFLRKIEKQQAILEKQRAVQDERDRIAYDMHDDLGSGLTKISYLSKEALRKMENQAELDRINETSLELVKNMSELIWAMKVENDSLADLMSYLRHYAVEYFDSNRIRVQMEVDKFPEDQQISGEIRRQIFLIFKEALHNIVKHAQTERVLIHIQLGENMRIVIRDYGKGLSDQAETRKSGNGMKTMRERTRKLNGTMELKSSAEGVELIFEFPVSGE